MLFILLHPLFMIFVLLIIFRISWFEIVISEFNVISLNLHLFSFSLSILLDKKIKINKRQVSFFEVCVVKSNKS